MSAELNQSIYFGIGDDDGQGMKNELGRFVEVIQQHSPKGLSWRHEVFENEGHMSAPLLANYYGLKFVEKGNYEGAITVLKRNTEAYPIYPANSAWLADAYEKNADYDRAIEAYSLALEKSKAINFGQEHNYIRNIERLSKITKTE